MLVPVACWFSRKIMFLTNGMRHIYHVEAKLHDESRLIQRCFDDNKDDDKGDDKKLKGQSKNEFKMFKIESRTFQDSRGKLISRIKNQDSRIKLSRINIKIQDSRFKNQEKT